MDIEKVLERFEKLAGELDKMSYYDFSDFSSGVDRGREYAADDIRDAVISIRREVADEKLRADVVTARHLDEAIDRFTAALESEAKGSAMMVASEARRMGITPARTRRATIRLIVEKLRETK